MIFIGLLILGIIMVVFGLLQAAHPPFQRWWYGTEWYNPGRKKAVDVNSEEYSTAIFHMKMAGGRAALIGVLLILLSLSQLGLMD